MNKFENLKTTAKGEKRAWVDLKKLKTLWFNTGTQCNLSCENCYIESNPTNDRLVYLTLADIKPYLVEMEEEPYKAELIGITGGEPFINPNIIAIIDAILAAGHKLLILTNAYKVLKRHQENLLKINEHYPNQLFLRISLDHYTKKVHEQERSVGTFDKTLQQVSWLVENGFNISIAGRSLVSEDQSSALSGYQNLLDDNKIKLSLAVGDNIVLFPEMIKDESVPEITVDCWGILNKLPEDQMCATERMIVRRKDADSAVVLPCTLLAYDKQFELGSTLVSSDKRVYLNHIYCAKFCVLGGASCSSAK